MKTIVTMTSWTGRIKYAGKAIHRFMTMQSVKPDIFYLWLAEEEFPKREKDLPEDLLLVCEAYNVNICWIKDNEYCFKRLYVYPKHYEDLVIIIDEDQIYDKDLIKDCKSIKFEKNVSYNIFSQITINFEYDGNGISYKKIPVKNNIPSILGNCNGNHIYPPKTFPLEAMSPENIEIRKRICKKCDESWLLPWLKYINGKTTYLNKKSRLGQIKEDLKTAMCTEMAKVVNGNRKRDIELYFILRTFPKLMKKWKEIYPKMNTEKWDKLTDEEIIKLLNY